MAFQLLVAWDRLYTVGQMLGKIKTYCLKCKKERTLHFLDDEGSYTLRCDCGCEIFRYHSPDKFHEKHYFTRNFIPKSKYKKDFKEKDDLEKMGFEKKENGKYEK